jgi:molecular chaperone DnaJ
MGQIIGSPCKECRGEGRVIAERKVSVQIPAGVDGGQQIRASGRGGAGERSARAGDLYVRVRVEPHELFKRRGDDIFYEVELTMVQAALGTTMTIPTLDGEVEAEFEPGTQPGETKVFRGKGVPHLSGHGRGDQEVTVTVLIPHGLDEQHRQLLRDLDEALTPDHYAPKSDGVLHKLRNLFGG